jgi:hypothetical protein
MTNHRGLQAMTPTWQQPLQDLMWWDALLTPVLLIFVILALIGISRHLAEIGQVLDAIRDNTRKPPAPGYRYEETSDD